MLIVGGVGISGADVYDPVTGNFLPVASMSTARYGHTATPLPSGKVLIVGGHSGQETLASAELYDPVSGTFLPTGSMAFARRDHTATLLPDGKVLVAGGIRFNLAAAEIYDPETGTFTATGSMRVGRSLHEAVLLTNGKVLITGGYSWSPLASAELYDPATGRFTLTGSMGAIRYYHTATALSDGNALVTGGYELASAERYDASSGTFMPIGNMSSIRFNHAATRLASGFVLMTGGFLSYSMDLATAELYDPSTGTFQPTGTMNKTRVHHRSTLLANGDVLITGGSSPFAEVYRAPVATSTPSLTVSDVTLTYDGQPHVSTVSLTGIGEENLGPVTVTYNGSPNPPVNVGTYSVVAEFGGNSAYESARAFGTLTITPAALTVMAADVAREFGEPNPVFTASYDGFVFGEGPEILAGTLTFMTPATISSPVGSYPITASGVSALNYTIIFVPGTLSVVDTTAPAIAGVTPSVTTLWSPNHRMVPVTLGVDADDAASSFGCSVASVSSSEPVNGIGDGDTAPDWDITGPLTVNLRAERAGKGSGRIYTVTVECRDAFNNVATAATTISVPHDRRR